MNGYLYLQSTQTVRLATNHPEPSMLLLSISFTVPESRRLYEGRAVGKIRSLKVHWVNCNEQQRLLISGRWETVTCCRMARLSKSLYSTSSRTFIQQDRGLLFTKIENFISTRSRTFNWTRSRALTQQDGGLLLNKIMNFYLTKTRTLFNKIERFNSVKSRTFI